jgi:hypothetical protein
VADIDYAYGFDCLALDRLSCEIESVRRGDIVLVSFPFTDLSSSKRRPARVVSQGRTRFSRRFFCF